MANPQKENGYTPTAHELVEAICTLNISGTSHRVLRYIERKTYGFNKKKDRISLSQFVEVLKTDRRTITRSIDELEKQNIIKINRDDTINEYSINKDYETWVGGKTPLAWVGGKMARTRGQNAPKTRGQNAPYKRNKEITKESPLNAEITNNKMNTYHPIDESGNPLRRRSSGKGKEIKARNAEYIKIGFRFEKLGELSTGVKPDLSKAYFIIKNARENCGVQDFEELFKYFFSDKKLQPEQKVSLAFCCSPAYITQWKVNQKNKVVSQVEASAEINL
jgi:phage replication O-like protein O